MEPFVIQDVIYNSVYVIEQMPSRVIEYTVASGKSYYFKCINGLLLQMPTAATIADEQAIQLPIKKR